MTTISVPKKSDFGGNPTTVEEAQALINHVASLCLPWNVDAMAEGFTEDCVCHFGLYPEMHGREAVREFFRARSRRQANYKCVKALRSLAGDTLAIDFTGTWEDTLTGKKMRGHGVEIWKLRGGKVAVWDAAINIAEQDEAAGLELV